MTLSSKLISALTLFTVLFASARTAGAEPSLTDSEHEEFASACAATASTIFNNKYNSLMNRVAAKLNGVEHISIRFDTSYNYWPSEIVRITDDGADILTIVKRTISSISNNNGWGDDIATVETYYASCDFENVARNSDLDEVSLIVMWKDSDPTVATCYSLEQAKDLEGYNMIGIFSYRSEDHEDFSRAELCEVRKSSMLRRIHELAR